MLPTSTVTARVLEHPRRVADPRDVVVVLMSSTAFSLVSLSTSSRCLVALMTAPSWALTSPALEFLVELSKYRRALAAPP